MTLSPETHHHRNDPTLFDLDPAAAKPGTRAGFEVFHVKHPDVYDELVAMARRAVAAGHRRLGMKQLWEVLRWNRMLASLPDDDEPWRLNNSYTAFYARLIMDTCPDLAGVFETRSQTL